MTADTPPPDDTALAAMAAGLGRALLEGEARLVVAESCTGGWIAKALTDIAGSSDWFERGYVTYSNRAKIEALGVAPGTIDTHGAVSAAVVAEMAAGARAGAGVEAAIAVSGIAGPGGAMPGKPVGLVWFAFELGERRWTVRAEFPGGREAVRRSAVAFALETLRAALLAA